MQEAVRPDRAPDLAFTCHPDAGRGDAGHERGVAEYLDDQLDSIYGENFSSVVEWEFKGAFGKGLYDVLTADPAQGRLVLRRIFRSDDAVSVIFETLGEKLRRLCPAPEAGTLLAVLQPPDRGPVGDGLVDLRPQDPV